MKTRALLAGIAVLTLVTGAAAKEQFLYNCNGTSIEMLGEDGYWFFTRDKKGRLKKLPTRLFRETIKEGKDVLYFHGRKCRSLGPL